jgi:SAM-dependent methyltransferase
MLLALKRKLFKVYVARNRSRVERLLDGIDPKTMSGLEVGPLDRPIVDRRRGYPIKYLDHDTTEALRTRFKDHANVDPAELAEIDFVITGGNILEVVKERFDYIVASQVFEHVPNPIQWLQEMATLLNPGGLLCLAIPDRRFTFDLIRPATSIGEMLEAYFTRRTRPTFKNVFDQNYYWRKVRARAAWAGTAQPWKMEPPLDKAVTMSYARRAIDTDEYLDVHCNIITGDEFLFFFDALRTYQLTVLELVKYHPCEPKEHEFFVQLRKA